MKEVEVIVLQRFKGSSNVAELVLTLLISGFLLKFILRVAPVMCLAMAPTKISVFDIIAISLLSVFSVLISLYFLFNEIEDEKLKRLFLNQRLTNLILALLGLFYLFNWFDKSCINYRIWVTIYSFIAIPCCLALHFIYLIILEIKQNSFKQEKIKLQNTKIYITKLWKTISHIAYEIMLVVVVLLFYSTLPIIYPYTTYGCGLGLVSDVHYSTILFLILISLTASISFIEPLIKKKKALVDVLTTSILRLLIVGLSLVGRKYFVSYQRRNCIIIAQEVWNIIISVTWVLGMSLVTFLVVYLLIRGRNSQFSPSS
ncbi:MAG: hypothetical protein KGD64_10470 [Candidatus Heimdallarchaeota archaeon]|nr:hypothetical protein [Candidatus Heimdallarchaeota archaeon]